jgi:hypothetical protein
MTAPRDTFKALTDAAIDAIGRELAQIRKDAETMRATMLAEHQAKMAQLDEFVQSTLTKVQSQVDARLAEVKDGAPGKDGERGEPGPMGSLAQCKAWEDRVYYQGETATFDGSIFQAQRDTGKEPPHDDWICIVRAGRDGADGRSFDHAGLYDPEKNYSALQVVQSNGASFVAKRDNPGECPGDGWALLASQGKTGKPGPKGDPGARGPAGPAVARLVVDDTGMLTLVNADGTKIECDLYPLLERIDR